MADEMDERDRIDDLDMGDDDVGGEEEETIDDDETMERDLGSAETPPEIRTAPIPVAPPVVELAAARASDMVWGQPSMEREKGELDDLFEVPEADDNDMEIDDLFELDEEDEDLSDLTSVSREDVMGAPPRSRRPARFRRTGRPYIPPSSLGGVR